jgi:hypothetical protein
MWHLFDRGARSGGAELFRFKAGPEYATQFRPSAPANFMQVETSELRDNMQILRLGLKQAQLKPVNYFVCSTLDM